MPLTFPALPTCLAAVMVLVCRGVAATQTPDPPDCHADVLGVFGSKTWTSPNISLITNTLHHIADLQGVSAVSSLGIQATSLQGGSVGGCSSIAGASLSGSSVPRSLVFDFDPPIHMYSLTTAGAIPRVTTGLRVAFYDPTPSDDVRTTAQSAAAVLDPDVAAVLDAAEAAAPGITADTFGNTWEVAHWDAPPPIQYSDPAGEGRRLAAGSLAHPAPRRQASNGMGCHQAPSPAVLAAAARGVGTPNHLGEACLDTPDRMQDVDLWMDWFGLGLETPARRTKTVMWLQRKRHLAFGIDDVVEATLIAVAVTRMRKLTKKVNRLQAKLLGLTSAVADSNAATNALWEASEATSRQQAEANTTISNLGTSIATFGAWAANVSTEIAEAGMTLGRLANASADLVASHAESIARITQVQTTANAAVQRDIAAMGNATNAATLALGQLASNLSARAWDALTAWESRTNDVMELVFTDLQAGTNVLHGLLRTIEELKTRNAFRNGLARQLHASLRLARAMGFVPLLGTDAKDYEPGPPDAWRQGSPLRALEIDTVLHFSTVDTQPSGVTLTQRNLTWVCDPLAGGPLFVHKPSPEALFDMLSRGSTPCNVSVGQGAPSAPAGAPPCLCWLRVVTTSCPVAVDTAPSGVVLAPPLLNGTDHPRTLTVSGIAGWVPPSGWNTSRLDLPLDLITGAVFPSTAFNASSGGGPGYRAFTPCTSPPVQSAPPVTIVTQDALAALMATLTCVSPPGRPRADSDAYMASLHAAVASGISPYLALVPINNGARVTNLTTGVTQLPGGLDGTGVLWPSEKVPLCTLDPAKALAVVTSSVGTAGWAPPVGVLLTLVATAWPDAYPSISAANTAAYGAIPPEVLTEFDPLAVQDGTQVMAAYAEVVLMRGEWERVGVATLQGVWARGRVGMRAVPGNSTSGDPGLPAFLADITNVWVGADLAAPTILGPRFNFACDPACATGTKTCTLPTNPAVHGRYLCDVPSAMLPTSTQSELRKDSLTYLWLAGQDTPPSLSNFTAADWTASNNGAKFNPGSRAGSLHQFVNLLVDAVEAGVTTRATGTSDVVCAKHGTPQARMQAEQNPDAASLCYFLLHNVLFTPDLEGADADLVGTPAEDCGKGGLLCSIPRRYTLTATGVEVPIGSVSMTLRKACPFVDVSLVNSTGWPVFRFWNPGTVSTGAWAYEFRPTNRSDPAGWVPGTTADVADRVCVSSGALVQEALVPGQAMTTKWLSVCSGWDIYVYIGEEAQTGTAPCRPPTHVDIPINKWAPGSDGGSASSSVPGSGSGSWSGSGSSSSQGSDPTNRMPLSFTSFIPELSDTAKEQTLAARVQVVDVYSTGLRAAIVQSIFLKSALATYNLTQLYNDTMTTIGVSWDAQDTATAATASAADLALSGMPNSSAFISVATQAAANLTKNSNGIRAAALFYGPIIDASEAAVNASLARLDTLSNGTRAAQELAHTAVQESQAAFDNLGPLFGESDALRNETALEQDLIRQANAIINARKRARRNMILSLVDTRMLTIAIFVVLVVQLVCGSCCSSFGKPRGYAQVDGRPAPGNEPTTEPAKPKGGTGSAPSAPPGPAAASAAAPATSLPRTPLPGPATPPKIGQTPKGLLTRSLVSAAAGARRAIL